MGSKIWRVNSFFSVFLRFSYDEGHDTKFHWTHKRGDIDQARMAFSGESLIGVYPNRILIRGEAHKVLEESIVVCLEWMQTDLIRCGWRDGHLSLIEKVRTSVYLLWVLQLPAQKRVYDYFNENLLCLRGNQVIEVDL